jgi:predicted RNA-binding protein
METGRTDFKKKVDGYQILSERSYRGELGPDEHPIFGRELRSKIATAQRDYARDRESLRKYAEEDGILEEWYDDDPSQHPADKAYAAYVKMVFDDDLEDDESGYFDFKERDKRLKELRDGPLTITDEDGKVIEVLQDGYGNEIIDKVEDELRKGEPHIVKKLREDRKRLDGYFKEFDRIIQNAGLEDVWERYKRTPPEGRSTFLRRTDSRDLKDVLNYINNGNSVIESPKIRWIKEKGEWADRLLIQWGYRSKAVFENVAKEFQARQIAIAERELTP